MEAAVLRAVGKHALPGGLTAAAFQALDLDVILKTRKKGGTLFEKNGAFSMVWQSPCLYFTRFESLHTCIFRDFSAWTPVFFAMRDARASASVASASEKSRK